MQAFTYILYVYNFGKAKIKKLRYITFLSNYIAVFYYSVLDYVEKFSDFGVNFKYCVNLHYGVE